MVLKKEELVKKLHDKEVTFRFEEAAVIYKDNPADHDKLISANAKKEAFKYAVKLAKEVEDHEYRPVVPEWLDDWYTEEVSRNDDTPSNRANTILLTLWDDYYNDRFSKSESSYINSHPVEVSSMIMYGEYNVIPSKYIMPVPYSDENKYYSVKKDDIGELVISIVDQDKATKLTMDQIGVYFDRIRIFAEKVEKVWVAILILSC